MPPLTLPCRIFAACQQLVHVSLRQSFTLLDTGPESREPPEARLLKPSLRGLWGRFQASYFLLPISLLIVHPLPEALGLLSASFSESPSLFVSPFP
jgi:hypothetical protein